MPSKHNPFEHLLSKLLAGGLSAGLVLAWWPALFDSEGVISWVWRGLAWTLLFELMLGALAPLEMALKQHPRTIKAKHFLARLFRPALLRLPSSSPLASAALLAVGAIALPVGLMVSRSDQVKQPRPTKLVKLTERKVVKPVKVVKVTKVVKAQVVAPPVYQQSVPSPQPRPEPTREKAPDPPVAREVDPPVVEPQPQEPLAP